MLQSLLKNWWLLVLRGVLLVLIGIIAFMNPGAAAATLVFWLAIFILADGIMAFITAITNWNQVEDKWLLLLDALVDILLGILIIRAPGVTLLLVAMYLAVWCIFWGVTKIAMAIQLRKEIKGELLLALSGVLSILLGIIVIAQPGIGISTLMWLIGIFALIAGITLIATGFRIRNLGHSLAKK